MNERVRLYSNVDDEEPLHVYADLDDGVVVLDQGGDRIAIPLEDWGRFVDACEALYTSGCPEQAE